VGPVNHPLAITKPITKPSSCLGKYDHHILSAYSRLSSQNVIMTPTPTTFAAMVAGKGQNPTKAQISTPKLEKNKALVKISHAAQNPTDSTILAPSTLAMTRR
jgi:hypothetical protein